jgi:hypothetical protein
MDSMAYVPGFKYDVFVSYAHADNVSFGHAPQGADGGWVGQFVEDLLATLRQRLGGARQLEIYYDRHRAESGSHTVNRIAEDVAASAMMISLRSPSYVEKHQPGTLPFTFREVTTYAAGPRGPDDLVVVELLPLEEVEPGFDLVVNAIPHVFHYEIAPGVSAMFGRQHEGYWPRIIKLANTLNKRLREMRKERGVDAEVVAPVRPNDKALDGRTVLLAQVTDDLLDEREQIVAHLVRLGAHILPQVDTFPSAAEPFRRAFEADLEKADLVVHLLSKVRGRRPPDVPMGYDLYQTQLIAEHNKSRVAGGEQAKPVLRWCEASVKVDEVTDEGLRQLLNDKDVLIQGLEAFKKEVVKRLEKPPEPPPAPAAAAQPAGQRGSGRIVFINAEQRDMQLAEELSKEVESEGFHATFPLRGATPQQIRSNLETQLKACDAVVVVYGAVEVDWVSQQLMQSTKALGDRDEDFKLRALYLAPPEEQPDVPGRVPGLVTVGGRKGFDPSEIRKILGGLRS